MLHIYKQSSEGARYALPQHNFPVQFSHSHLLRQQQEQQQQVCPLTILSMSHNDQTQRYNLRSRAPKRLNELFAITDIRNSLIGHLDSWEILKLERAGVRARVSPRIHGKYYRGVQHQCDNMVNFHVHRRRNRMLQIAGVDQCPNTNINTTRLKRCEGSLRHAGGPFNWDHEDSLRFEGRWEPLVTFRSNDRHPPGLGPAGAMFRVCSECLRDAEYNYMDPPYDVYRRLITNSWVPLCKTHSLQIFKTLQEQWTPEARRLILCRCVTDINCGWACEDHRLATLSAIQRRANHHIAWLRQTHLRRPCRPRLRTDYERENKRTRRERQGGRRKTQWYVDETKNRKKWPGCPAYGCGKPSWKSLNALEKLAKCLGCGGTQPCTGELGDLRPK